METGGKESETSKKEVKLFNVTDCRSRTYQADFIVNKKPLRMEIDMGEPAERVVPRRHPAYVSDGVEDVHW